MKKKMAVLAAVLLAIGLTACGNNEGQAASDTTQTIQAESSQETETANNTEEEAQQVVTSEAASNTNDESADDTSSEETGSSKENSGCMCRIAARSTWRKRRTDARRRCARF